MTPVLAMLLTNIQFSVLDGPTLRATETLAQMLLQADFLEQKQKQKISCPWILAEVEFYQT